MPEPAQLRLERLLYVLPAASREGGARLDDLASALGVPVHILMRDIEEATARAFYLPPGESDSLQIIMENDRVQVFAGQQFQRPVRLSRREALTLGLGLRMLAAEKEAPEHDRLLRLASHLEGALSAPVTLPPPERAAPQPEPPATSTGTATPPGLLLEIEADAGPIDVALGDDGFRGVLADGIRETRRLALRYLRPGDAEPRERLVEPLRLVYANGRWYLLARPVDTDDVRVYRVDRVLDAKLTEQHFASTAFDASRFIDDGGHAYSGQGAAIATVRYSPRVARWIAERTGQRVDTDGSITVEHRVADADWLARHVLQYGAEAEVVQPPELRAHVARTARRLASA
jgi:proteasome accessory factor C